MNNAKEIFYKIFEDDFESEAVAVLKQDLKRELKKPHDEINFQNVCDTMFEIIQIEEGMNY